MPPTILHPHGFTEADCQNCTTILTQSHPAVKERLDLLRQAGFPLESVEQDNDANKQYARGLLASYAPTRMPPGV